MDKNDKKTVTTEAQKFSPSADGSDKLSDSVVTIEALKKRAEELENKYKRALADYQNLEKRAREERQNWILRANKDLLLHLLPVLDTLILAKKHIKVQDEGLGLSIKQFQDLLKGEGVDKIDVVGKQFDPNIMQCVETKEAEDGKVLEELESGYMLYDKVLRPALVSVGKSKIEKKEEEKAKKELQRGDYM